MKAEDMESIKNDEIEKKDVSEVKHPKIKKFADFVYKYIPRYSVVPFVLSLLAILVSYTGARVVNLIIGRTYIDMTTAFDEAIPFVSQAVFIYVFAFPFWAISFIVVGKVSRDKCYRMVSASIIGKLVLGLFFLLIPSTNVRPAFELTNFSTLIMKIVYGVDLPNNLFPSMHCLESWFCFVALRQEKKVPVWAKVFSFVFAIMICLSTMYTKQHVWADVVSGVVIAEIIWLLTRNVRLSRFYLRVEELIKLP